MPTLKMNEPIKNTVPYKFSLGESVIYIDLQTGKPGRGEIVAVSTYTDNRQQAVNYTLKSSFGMVGNVPQTVIFRTRDEALNWAIEIANSLE